MSKDTQSHKVATRRTFLKTGAGASAFLLAQPLLNAAAVGPAFSERRTLLKNGLLVNGTGAKGVIGSLLIKGTRVEAISQGPINAECQAIDCTGKVIAPGFIDIHSHMDWVLPLEGHPELRPPLRRKVVRPS